METIFRCSAITVFHMFFESSCDDIWISFGAANNLPFGESYFQKKKQSAFLLATNVNNWYQQPEIWEAVSIIKERLTAYRGRIVCYGSSMGGFAALAFSSYFGATHVIAAGPQISIAPDVVGEFDNRWTDIGGQLTFQVKDARDHMSASAVITLMFDSMHREDKIHASLIDARRPVRLLKFPNSGHACLHALQEVGVLETLLLAALDVDEKSKDIYSNSLKDFRARSLSTCAGNFAIAEYYLDRNRLRQSLRWLDRILKINPAWPVYNFAELCLDRMAKLKIDNLEDYKDLKKFLIDHEQYENASAVDKKEIVRFPSSYSRNIARRTGDGRANLPCGSSMWKKLRTRLTRLVR